MRRFIVNRGTKLIISKQYDTTPLDINKLRCTRLFHFNEDRSIQIYYIQPERQRFQVVEVKDYDYNEEYICYGYVTDLHSDNTETDMGLLVKIPRTKDRIIVEPCIDFEPCDAVEIIEES